MNNEIIKLTPADMNNVTVFDEHAVLQNHLTHLRKKSTPSKEFRHRLRCVATILGSLSTADLTVTHRRITTPLATIRKSPVLPGNGPIIASVLRAGNGLLEGMMDVIYDDAASHIGLERDEISLEPREYYFKTPPDIEWRDVLLVDPMLATAGSSIAATNRLLMAGASSKRIRFICVLAAPYGVRAYRKAFPNIPIFTAAIDRCLNDKGYIVPGLGDAGDRMYGTK